VRQRSRGQPPDRAVPVFIDGTAFAFYVGLVPGGERSDAEPTVLPVEKLTDQAFAPFGRVIRTPERVRDAEGPGWRWWAETMVLDGDNRSWGVGYLDLEPTSSPRFDWAERHLRSLEAIVPVEGGCLVYVGPAEHLDHPGRLPAVEDFRAFRVPSGSGVVMDRGVWHGAPFADGGPAKAIVLLLEGTDRDDVTVVRFEAAPVLIGEG
jgi:ureidoglycolate lyase